MNFLVKLLNYFKDWMALKNPVVYAGLTMISFAVGGQGLIVLSGSVILKEEFPILKSIELFATNQSVLMNFGCLALLLAGIFIVWHGIKNVKKDVQPIYIRGLSGQREEFPEELLVGPDKMKNMGAHRFGVILDILGAFTRHDMRDVNDCFLIRVKHFQNAVGVRS